MLEFALIYMPIGFFTLALIACYHDHQEAKDKAIKLRQELIDFIDLDSFDKCAEIDCVDLCDESYHELLKAFDAHKKGMLTSGDLEMICKGILYQLAKNAYHFGD